MKRIGLLALTFGLSAGSALAQSPGNFSLLQFQNINVQGRAPLDTSLTQIQNPNAILAASGNRVSFCPALSCVSSGTFSDHQRTSLLVSAQTELDGAAEEQTLAVATTVGTGYARPYAASTAYAAGDNVNVGDATYRAVQAGTTGANSPPPRVRPGTQGQTFADGSVVWQWINDSAINAKAGIYNEQIVKPGAGSTWGQATNVELQPGMIPTFNVNTEFDFGNRSGIDCGLGNGDCFNLFIRAGGTNMLTAAVTIDSKTDAPWSAYWGLRVTGPKTAKLGDIVTDASGEVGVGICSSGFDICHHSRASILDQSISPIGLQFLQGAPGTTMHAVATIVDDTTSPTFVSIAGNKSFAGIFEHSTTPIGIRLEGSYSDSAIRSNGFSVDPIGFTRVAGLNMGTGTPPSSSASCNNGDIRFDGTSIYACVATNHWKRSPLEEF